VAPARLDAAWLDGLAQLPHPLSQLPLLVGGRSAGARVACRTAGTLSAAGVLSLAFPLHPPGRPDKTRVDELAAVRVPVRVVQGGADPFGTPAEFPSALDVVGIAGADHSFGVSRAGPLSPHESLECVVDAIVVWIAGMPAR
jgi:predicted alpha/beta-hydrolase family hydrolase